MSAANCECSKDLAVLQHCKENTENTIKFECRPAQSPREYSLVFYFYFVTLL